MKYLFIIIPVVFCGCAHRLVWDAKAGGDEVIFYKSNSRLNFQKNDTVRYFGYDSNTWTSAYADIDGDGIFDECLDLRERKYYLLLNLEWCPKKVVKGQAYALVNGKTLAVHFVNHKWRVGKRSLSAEESNSETEVGSSAFRH